MQDVLAVGPRDRIIFVLDDHEIHLRTPVLILVGLRETPEIFEEDRDPVVPSVEGVLSLPKSRKGEELSLHFERSVRDSFRVFGDDGKSDSPEEVGSEGDDVSARVEGLGVRMLGDD